MANARFILAEAADNFTEAIAELAALAGKTHPALAPLERARAWVLRDAPAEERDAICAELRAAAHAAWWDTVDRDMYGIGRYVEATMEMAETIVQWNFVVGPSTNRRNKAEDEKLAAGDERNKFVATRARREAEIR